MCDVFVNIAKGLQIIAIPWVMTHLTWDCESVALDKKTINPFSNRWCHKEVKKEPKINNGALRLAEQKKGVE